MNALLRRSAWTVWALIPVGMVAWHFGPGQQSFVRDQAARLQNVAMQKETIARDAQSAAYDRHLAAIEARKKAFLSQSDADETFAAAATASEDAAYAKASDAWQQTAEAYFQVESVLAQTSEGIAEEVRLAKGRAMVRAGDIWNGIDELETLLAESVEDSQLAEVTRDELGAAYYYGARLMRLTGEPAESWRSEAAKARQHFRYLAEEARADGASAAHISALENNVEVVLNLEQQDLSEIEGSPLPRQSPRSQNEGKCKNCNSQKKSKKPPQKKDGRGAGGAGEIGQGW